MDTGYFFLAPYLADGDDDDMEGGRVGLSKFRPWRRPPEPGGDAAPALEKKVPLSMRPRSPMACVYEASFFTQPMNVETSKEGNRCSRLGQMMMACAHGSSSLWLG